MQPGPGAVQDTRICVKFLWLLLPILPNGGVLADRGYPLLFLFVEHWQQGQKLLEQSRVLETSCQIILVCCISQQYPFKQRYGRRFGLLPRGEDWTESVSMAWELFWLMTKVLPFYFVLFRANFRSCIPLLIVVGTTPVTLKITPQQLCSQGSLLLRRLTPQNENERKNRESEEKGRRRRNKLLCFIRDTLEIVFERQIMVERQRRNVLKIQVERNCIWMRVLKG